MLKARIALLVAVVPLVAGAAATGTQSSIGPVRELLSPAASPSAQPQLTVTPDGRVVLSWLEDTAKEKTRAFRYAIREGDRWSSASTIVERDRFFVNWADVPSIFATTDGRLAAHWLQYNGSGTYAYDVRVSLSDPQGKNWTPDVSPHRDGTQKEHGFASFFDWPGGGTGVVWLDGREIADGQGSHDAAGGAMTLRAARLTRDGNVMDETRIDDRVCECCPTTAVATTHGALVAYRDRSPQEVRDIGVIRFENGTWQPPTLVHADNWTINACPVNGPALAAVGDRVVLAWFTAEGDVPRALAAFSSDAGKTWGQPIRIDDAKSLGRVDAVMLDDGRAAVLWMEHLENGSELRARLIHPDGKRNPHVVVSPTSADRQAGYARMVRSGSELIFAWVATKPTPQVKTAVMSLR